MKKQIGIIAALWLLACAFVHADSSYLLIQGDFGLSGTTPVEQTFKYQVDYPTDTLSTGQDLLDTVFGTPTAHGTDPANGDPLYYAGTAAQNVQYDSTSYGLLLIAFTFNSITITADNDSSPTTGWNYYVAGGSGTYGGDDNGGPYDPGTWTFANDGADGRTIDQNSFDGWVFGSSGYDPDYSPDGDTAIIDGSNNDPTVADFAGAQVVDVPEPGSVAMLAGGAGLLFLAIKRRR